MKIVKLPPGLIDDGVMNTKSVFAKCLGHVFRIQAFQKDWLELEVGKVTGKRFETIWIEPEYVELVTELEHD